MYFAAIASTCPLTSREKAFSCSSRSEFSCASTSRSKLSSGNLASIGASRSTRITASTRSPFLNPYCSEYASAGSRSRNRLPSNSSPKPPRAFGGRSTCCSWPSSFACSARSAVAGQNEQQCRDREHGPQTLEVVSDGKTKEGGRSRPLELCSALGFVLRRAFAL